MPKPVIELESSRLLEEHCQDRPTCQGRIGNRRFQLFCFEPALLFIDLGSEREYQQYEAAMEGALVGGVCGGLVGAAIGQAVQRGLQGPQRTKRPTNIRNCSEAELFELAKLRKRSFVVVKEAIRRIRIEAPTGFERIFASKSLQGFLRLKARGVGSVMFEFHCLNEMAIAIEALPSRLPCDMPVDAVYHKRHKQFVRR